MSEPTPLPPYTGGESEFVSDTRCVKCGWFEASTTYKDSLCCVGRSHDEEVSVLNGPPRRDGAVPGVPVGPRLCRRCKRCGYAWDEACIDTPAEPVKLTVTVDPPEEPASPTPPPPAPSADAIAVKDTRPRPKEGPVKALVGQIMFDSNDTGLQRRMLEEAAAARAAVTPRRSYWG